MVNNNILNTQHQNTYVGLKLIFTSATLEEMCTQPDGWILQNSHKFMNLDVMDYSNFISNVNAGKVFYTNNIQPEEIPVIEPFKGYNENLITLPSQTLLLAKPSLGITNPDLTVIYDLIKFNRSCPDGWNSTVTRPKNMTDAELGKCEEIAKKISGLNDPLLTKLLQTGRTDACTGDACLKRISELRFLGRSDDDDIAYPVDGYDAAMWNDL